MHAADMLAYLDGIDNLAYRFGQSKNKVEAINSDISDLALPDWQILILASDDMIPVVRGYDDVIAQDMHRNWPDLSGGLWYNDGGLGADKLWTLAIMGRAMYDRWGYVYCPEYESVFVDNDAQMRASREGKLKYLPRVLVKHEWINVTGRDALHQRNENGPVYARDKATFARRQRDGFRDKARAA